MEKQIKYNKQLEALQPPDIHTNTTPPTPREEEEEEEDTIYNSQNNLS